MQAADRAHGFTLVEVLIALAITAFVSTIAYTSLSTVMTGVESTREATRRTVEINRAWAIISRDLRHFVARPVRDEFGEEEPALAGGPASRFYLSFTRAGWHNPADHPRGNLQRVNYRLQDNALWRDSYPVLDRAGDTEAREVMLLEDVEQLQLFFLASVGDIEAEGEGITVDTRNWVENWVSDTSVGGQELAPPVAIEFRLELADQGEMRRIYALPPL
jgi:general secretion pathway protein J